MGKTWPRVIRDPVHDIIAFDDTPQDRLLLNLINTKEFQRLRRIKQLGVSDMVFPGANHSRFAHCIGAMHVARQMLDRIARPPEVRIEDEQRAAVLAAALLHDVGHGPFSHAFEKVSGERHEARTLQIITDPSTEVYAALRDFDPKLPNRLALFFDEDIEAGQRDGADLPAHLTQVVASQLDADRFDYLLRDSYATGTNYGRYDLNWLILQLHLDSPGGRFFLSHKALSAAEAYVFARYHMYRSVYFHKTTRAAEVMLRLLFARYKQLLRTSPSEEQRKAVVPGAPNAVLDAFDGALALNEFLALDDYTFSEFFKACAASSDPVLKPLGQGLIDRKLLKAIDLSDKDSAAVANFHTQATEKMRQLGHDPEYALASDTPSDTPYQPYDPVEGKSASQIYVADLAGKRTELSLCSDAINVLRKKYKLTRYYFPEAIRPEIEAIAAATLG